MLELIIKKLSELEFSVEYYRNLVDLLLLEDISLVVNVFIKSFSGTFITFTH